MVWVSRRYVSTSGYARRGLTACSLLHAQCICQHRARTFLHALLTSDLSMTYANLVMDYFTLRDNFCLMRTDETVRRRGALLLHERGIRNNAFAVAADRKPSWVSMFLRGTRPFPFERIDEVAEFFQSTPVKFVAPLTKGEIERASEALKIIQKGELRAPAQKRRHGNP